MIIMKTPEQIEGIRTSCRLLTETFRVLRPHIKPGITPKKLDGIAYDFIVSHGGKPAFLGHHGFPGTLCTSVNEAVIHGIPDDRPLRDGDILSIDCGINLGGFFSDSAFTVPIGQVSPEISDLLTSTKESLFKGISQAMPGNRVKDISRAVYKHVHAKGYGVVRPYCGHGVGLYVHEDPQIPNYVGGGPNPRLKPGMVIAIEPMVNLGGDDVRVLPDDWTVVTRDGTPSAHFEHTVAILEDGPEILTSWE
ncbi:type I methionyl aminopeptidase [Spirochaeta lutea]|uniref:Methionine aminopeptidase n=1 Tax=Spirochaeta lutea TaxID=1480694 RepID=A0A098R1R0_9SPIO|nr:type I methionyl aminopeptidase [Spirochaeta lutea]KGE73716.1 methionine aminopeptidase [Spirochaeta lutea]